MSRVDPDRLRDLEPVFDEVRAWSGVEDRGGGTFYLKRKPFLHFHVRPAGRRADVRTSGGWVEMDLPDPVTTGDRSRLLELLRVERDLR